MFLLKNKCKDTIKKISYHASGEVVRYPAIRISQYTKNFSQEFYCNIMYEQVVRLAKRRNCEIVNSYEYKENSNLKIKKFECINDEWLDFVVIF